jgi:hypothetical protein
MKPPAQFVKLMMMTTTSNDHEALVAIRKANAILASANVNWEEFLGAVDEVKTSSTTTRRTNSDSDFSDIDGTSSYQGSGACSDASLIDPMFERAFANVRPNSSFREFVDSIHEWWETKGYLTQRQFQALRKAAS